MQIITRFRTLVEKANGHKWYVSPIEKSCRRRVARLLILRRTEALPRQGFYLPGKAETPVQQPFYLLRKAAARLRLAFSSG